MTGVSGAVNVTGVRDELAQVVQNLIDNALKYSEKGGVVDVEVLSGLGPDEAAALGGRRWDDAGRMSIGGAGGR